MKIMNASSVHKIAVQGWDLSVHNLNVKNIFIRFVPICILMSLKFGETNKNCRCK